MIVRSELLVRRGVFSESISIARPSAWLLHVPLLVVRGLKAQALLNGGMGIFSVPSFSAFAARSLRLASAFASFADISLWAGVPWWKNLASTISSLAYLRG